MPRISEMAPKGPSKLSKLIFEMDDEEFDLEMAEFEQTRRRAADWTDSCRTRFTYAIMLCEEYELYYQKAWRRTHPKASDDPWRARDSQQLADRLTAYLYFRLKHTKGQAENGKIAVKTFRVWARSLSLVATYYVKGEGGRGAGRDVRTITGHLPDRSDSLHNKLLNWVHSTAEDEGLSRVLPKNEFWGLPEAALIFAQIDLESRLDPTTFLLGLQRKMAVSIMLMLGVRPGTMMVSRSGSKTPFFEHDVTIEQTSPNAYRVLLTFTSLKGFSQIKNPGLTQTFNVDPVTKLHNLKFDLAPLMIPRFLFERKLYTRNSNGSETVFGDVESFLNSRNRFFYVKNTDTALVRAIITSSKKLDKSASLSDSFSRQIKRICEILGMPGSRNYVWRHNVGDIARIAGGAELQATVLHHGATYDAGRIHYSHGAEDSGISRLVLREFLDTDQNAVNRLDSSHYLARSRNGRAIQATIRMLADSPDNTIDKEHTEAKVVASLKVNPDYQALLKRLLDYEENADESNEIQMGQLRELRAERIKVVQALRASILAEEKKVRRARVNKHPGGTMDEHEAAINHMDLVLFSKPGYLMERTDLALLVNPKRPAILNNDPGYPSIFHYEDDDDLDMIDFEEDDDLAPDAVVTTVSHSGSVSTRGTLLEPATALFKPASTLPKTPGEAEDERMFLSLYFSKADMISHGRIRSRG
jgi:hypothetical protein